MNLSFGLDLGSSTIKLAVSEMQETPKFLWGRVVQSRGLKKGMVKDRVALKNTLTQLLEEAESALNQAVSHVVVGVHTEVQSSRQRGSVLVSNEKPISQEDIDRASSAARAGVLPANREVVVSSPITFNLDGASGIDDPTGMVGTRLESEVLVVAAPANILTNIKDVLGEAGWDAETVTLSPLGAAAVALSKRDKELGSMLIDIGGDTTSVLVHYEGKLVWVETLKVGSSSITNDLAVGLRINVEEAETLKTTYGSAWAKDLSRKEKIKLGEDTISRREVAEIVEARVEEILELARGVVKNLGLDKKLPGGALFVGGGAKLPGIVKLGRHALGLPARVVVADEYFEGREQEAYDCLNALGLSFMHTRHGAAKGFFGKLFSGRLKSLFQS